MENSAQKQLLKDIEVSNASTTWYQDEMRKVIGIIQRIESGDLHSTSEYYQELQGKLYYLLGKGIFERRLLIQIINRVKENS